jgi:hypothetical protein
VPTITIQLKPDGIRFDTPKNTENG